MLVSGRRHVLDVVLVLWENGRERKSLRFNKASLLAGLAELICLIKLLVGQ